jgi:hypothetical protein
MKICKIIKKKNEPTIGKYNLIFSPKIDSKKLYKLFIEKLIKKTSSNFEPPANMFPS